MMDEFGNKWLLVGQLKGLLDTLLDDVKVCPNKVRNLGLYDSNDKMAGLY